MIRMKNHLELLANELIHEIFDYLSSIDMIKCFSQLNKRFSLLISQRLLKVDFSHLSKTQFENFNTILPFNQIISLKISNKWTINILSRFSFHSMTNLRILLLSHINSNDLRELFQSKNFLFIQQLHTFKIQSTNLNGIDRERIFVLKKLFSQMPKLRSCQLPFIDVNDFDDLIPSLTLERLIIDYCTMTCLGRLFDYIPYVQHLTVGVYIDLQNVSKCSLIPNPRLIDSNVRSLQISTINNIPFNQIEDLFRNSLNRLENFIFFFKTDASSQSSLDYINHARWEILLQSFLFLQQFHCCIELPIHSETSIKTISNSFEQNQFFLQRNWKFSVQTYTYSFNTILRLHTQSYQKRRLDIIATKAFVDNSHIYSRVRDLRILIDIIPINILSHLSGIIYRNVTSLTLISNKDFNEQTFLNYLYSIINLKCLHYLTIQLDNCSKTFLRNLIEKFSKLYSLTISTYHSWQKLIPLSLQISKSSIRSLIVYEVFDSFNQYEYLHQLLNQLEIISITVSSIEDCYRLLTLLFIGNKTKTIEKLRSLTIKCDFNEPDTIAHWVRANILRKLSYKCTTSVLTIWL